MRRGFLDVYRLMLDVRKYDVLYILYARLCFHLHTPESRSCFTKKPVLSDAPYWPAFRIT